MTATGDAIVDPLRFGRLRAEVGGEIGRILGYFREDAEQAIGAIEQATRARDAVALVRPAHRLKGEALQIGATPLGRLAAAIEQAARDAVEDHVFPAEVIEQVVLLRPLFGRTLVLLDAEAARPARPTRPTGFGRKPAAR